MDFMYKIIIFLLGVCCYSAFIVPNELPTILSLVYSNIPPLKIGQDTRLGFGFRLGPHADFQTLLEIGPQTNTGSLAPEAPAKRNSLENEQSFPAYSPTAEQAQLDLPAVFSNEKNKKKSALKKPARVFPEKVTFKKVPGIDD